MKRIKFISVAFVAMFMLSASTAWAQYVKVTNGGKVSWVAIKGTVDGEKFKVGNWQVAIDASTEGALDLNEVWSESGGTGTHYQVTEIRPLSFQNCSGLTSVKIPNSVMSIGMSAFQDCSGLTSVKIPNSVTSIGSFAFHGCSGMTSINIPNRVTSIEQFTFTNCKKISSITIPNSVTSIGPYAFAWCTSLTSLTLSSNVESIMDNAFRGDSSLISLTIPSKVSVIGPYAFQECYGLTSMVVETGNKKYDSRENCNAIIETATNTLMAGCQNTVIPNSVTSIGENAFYFCLTLTSIVIPSSVKSIGKKAFFDCRNLSTINSYIKNVFETGEEAFKYSQNATLYVPKGTVSAYRAKADWNRITNIVARTSSYDVNNDGSVDISDVVTLVNAILSSSPMLESNDVNGDGQVDISDVVALVNIILGQ